MTQIGVIGAGRIGTMIARHLARAGHDVLISFSRDPAKLNATAQEIGARAGTPQEAATQDVVVLSVPWTAVDDVLNQVKLDGKVVVDTTNQFRAAAGRRSPTASRRRSSTSGGCRARGWSSRSTR